MLHLTTASNVKVSLPFNMYRFFPRIWLGWAAAYRDGIGTVLLCCYVFLHFLFYCNI